MGLQITSKKLMLAFIMKKRVAIPLLEVGFCQKKIGNFQSKITDLKNQLAAMIYDEHYLTVTHPQFT